MTTVTVTEKPTGDQILVSPIWLLIVRGFQFVLSLICLALAGDIMKDVYLDEFGLNVAVAVLTWVAIAYLILTEKVPVLQVAYHIIAVLVIEGLMVVLWLATFAATAARRGAFRITSNTSFPDIDIDIKKRSIVVFYDKGLKLFAATAGMGALVWLLFVASAVWTYIMFFKGRSQGHFQIGNATTTTTDNYQLEGKAQAPAAAAPVAQQPPQAQYTQQTYTSPPAQAGYPQDQQAYGQYPPQQYQQQETVQTYQNVSPQGQPPSAASPPPHPQ